MSIQAKDLIENVIRPALKDISLWSKEAEQLLAGTCAQESQMGTYLRQIEGPAKGIVQMEPATHNDIWVNYLKYRPDLGDLILKTCYIPLVPEGVIPDSNLLIYNLKYAICMARIKYCRCKEALPKYDDTYGQAAYWKNNYNSASGKGDTAAYVNNYARFVKSFYQI